MDLRNGDRLRSHNIHMIDIQIPLEQVLQILRWRRILCKPLKNLQHLRPLEVLGCLGFDKSSMAACFSYRSFSHRRFVALCPWGCALVAMAAKGGHVVREVLCEKTGARMITYPLRFRVYDPWMFQYILMHIHAFNYEPNMYVICTNNSQGDWPKDF